MTRIHATAVVDPRAKLDDEVELEGLGTLVVTAIDYPDPCA